MVEKHADVASTEPAGNDEATAGRPLERRRLFRGAAVLAGAAGVVALGSLPTTADAADGQTLKVGGSYRGSGTTSLTIDAGDDPALKLSNPDGPALRLGLLDDAWDGELEPGDLAATVTGPLVGADFGDGPVTTYLATGVDLAATPVPVAVSPRRLLDTRRDSGGEAVLRSSSRSAQDSAGRLVAGAWIDVAVAYGGQETGVLLSAAFLNVAAVLPTGDGYLTVYAPGSRPAVSSLNVTGGVTLANAAFVALGTVYQDYYVVRIYSSTTTHVLVDLSGAVLAFNPLGGEGGVAGAQAARRTSRQAKRAAALRRSLR